MQQVKSILPYLLIIPAILLVILGGFVVYLELYVIPDILARTTAAGATLMTLAHIFMLLFLMGGSAWLGAKLREKDIFHTQQQLVSSHLNTVIGAVQNLATGRWSSDEYTHRDAFKTGTVFGHKLGQAQAGSDISDALILEGLERMSLPAPAQMGGQSQVVVDEMSEYLDNVAVRRRRLSG